MRGFWKIVCLGLILPLPVTAQFLEGSNLGGRLEGENFSALPGFELETSDDPFTNAGNAIDVGRYIEAAGFAAEAERTAGTDTVRARAVKLQGDIYALWLRMPEEAARHYGRYLEKFPKGADAGTVRFRRAQSLYDAGKIPDARKAFQDYFDKTSAKDPNRGTAQIVFDDLKPVLEGKKPYVPPPPETQTIKEEAGTSNPDVRVALVWDTARVNLDCKVECSVQGLAGTPSLTGPAAIDLASFTGAKIALTPKKEGEIHVEGKPYRGYVTVEKWNGKLLAVNVIPVEGYLRGVVPVEVSASWDDAAQRAQAIMARSYVLAQKVRRTGAPFDVYNTVLSQAYGGRGVEKERSDRAVRETAGQVLIWNGSIVMAYFHAHSGGSTEDPKDVWGGAVPYMTAQPDPYSVPQKLYTWQGTVPLSQIASNLGVSTVNAVSVGQRSTGGRARSLVFETDAGRKELSGKPFRALLGRVSAQSTHIQPSIAGNNLVLDGTGAGHGVGLAQVGALQMAKQGKSHGEILKFYIPAAEIKRI